MGTDSAIEACSVCGELMDASMRAECNWCDAAFHLNQRNDTDAKDCGEVWIDEQYLALQFACNNCLQADGTSPASGDHARPKAEQPSRPRRYKRRA